MPPDALSLHTRTPACLADLFAFEGSSRLASEGIVEGYSSAFVKANLFKYSRILRSYLTESQHRQWRDLYSSPSQGSDEQQNRNWNRFVNKLNWDQKGLLFAQGSW
jgi:hypothetical protein